MLAGLAWLGLDWLDTADQDRLLKAETERIENERIKAKEAKMVELESLEAKRIESRRIVDEYEAEMNERERLETAGVYFITDGDHIKIGRSNNLKNRIASLQTANPKPLKVLGVKRGAETTVERELHERFSAMRGNGEWFEDWAEIREYIESNCELEKGKEAEEERGNSESNR